MKLINMILIAFLFFFVIYLFVIYLISSIFNKICKRQGKIILGKVLSSIIMFGAVAIIFWDAIPTWRNHKNLCHTEFGLKVYMTPEEWAKKYPERFSRIEPAPEHLSSERIIKPRREISINHLNSEIDSIYVREMEYKLGVMRDRRQFIDSKTGEILADFIDFAGGVSGGSIATGANSLADYKFWLTTLGCGFAYSDLRDKYDSDIKSEGKIYDAMSEWGKK